MRTLFSYENGIVLLLSAVGGVAAIDMLAFAFLSPFVATDLHLSNSQIGLIGGTGLVTWAVGGISSSALSDQFGRRRIFLVGALLSFALLSTVTAFARTFATLVAARLLVGLSEGPVLPMQSAIMLGASSAHRRGLNMGITMNFGATLVGGIAGPLILVSIATQLGWRNAFLIAGAPALVLAVIVQLSVRETAVAIDRPPSPPLWQTIRVIAAVRNIRLCFLIGSCAVAWLGSVSTFIPLWIIRQWHFEPSAIGVTMACFGAGAAAGSILAPALSDRFGRRPAVVGFALLGIIGPLGLLFGPANLPILGAFVFAGSLLNGIFPLFIGIIPMESVDARHGATALSIVTGCAQIVGSVVGPLLGGALADRFSLAVPFLLAIGFSLGAALIGRFLTETAPIKRPPEHATA